MKSKALVIIGIILLIVVGSVVFLFISSNKNILAQKNNKSNKSIYKDNINISPQTVNDRVTVNSATLSKDGFVVVREMEGDKLSQIVEISKPLKSGTHKNISVLLGNAKIGNSELIVMIYEDYGHDGIFNDFDMPAINSDGFMTASYVKTGKPLPAIITEDSSSVPSHNMPGMQGMVKVRYTDKGFVPDKFEVPAGTMVEFINDSSTVMWVASAPHPQHTDLPTFDQFKSTKKGSIYRYVFDKKGTWGFHDHITPNRGGMVTVI